MRAALKHIVFLIFSILLTCCDDGLQDASVYKRTDPFEIIELNSVFEVYLVQDSVYAIEIVGSENTIGNVAFRVSDGILHISNQSKAKWLHPENNKIRLYIHSDMFSEVWPNETCSIRSVNTIVTRELRIIVGNRPKLTEIDLMLDCDKFYYWNNFQCGGKVVLRGSATYMELNLFALVSVDGRDLATHYAIIENNSKGDCEVDVSEQLEYSIRGRGNIYLHGSPVEIILDEQTSSGRLIEVP